MQCLSYRRWKFYQQYDVRLIFVVVTNAGILLIIIRIQICTLADVIAAVVPQADMQD